MVRRLSHFLFQPRCLGCQAALPPGRFRFCLRCLRDLSGPWSLKSPAVSSVLYDFRTEPHPLTTELLRRKLGEPPRDRWVVPVPTRRGSRMELLARAWAPGRVLSVLRKPVPRMQHGLSARERFDAPLFLEVTRPVAGFDLLVLDDVSTTGTTALQARVVLLRAGARSVEFRSVVEGGYGQEKEPEDEHEKVEPAAGLLSVQMRE